eukprot:scaffold78614_cov60-Phaeocystis_antarctica.AAC.3
MEAPSEDGRSGAQRSSQPHTDVASTAVEVWKTCRTLARVWNNPTGVGNYQSASCRRALLIQLLRPGMSDVEASGSTGASKISMATRARQLMSTPRENCIAPDIAFTVWTTNSKSARARVQS